MASVLVFVDDAVLGTLPPVCSKDGVPTADKVRIRGDVGDRSGMGVAWLLLLFGPLGWLGMAIMAAGRGTGPESFTVEVPMSEPAYQRLRRARRLRRNALLGGVLGGAVVLAMLVQSNAGSPSAPWQVLFTMAVAAVVLSIVVLFVADRRIRDALVGVDLDGTRRWVTLSRVHPAFVAACNDQLRDRQRA